MNTGKVMVSLKPIGRIAYGVLPDDAAAARLVNGEEFRLYNVAYTARDWDNQDSREPRDYDVYFRARSHAVKFAAEVNSGRYGEQYEVLWQDLRRVTFRVDGRDAEFVCQEFLDFTSDEERKAKWTAGEVQPQSVNLDNAGRGGVQ